MDSPFADWVASPPRRAYYFRLGASGHRRSPSPSTLTRSIPISLPPEFDKFIEAVKENGATNLGAGLPFYTSFQRSTCRTWAAISPLVASQTSSQPLALAAIASNAQAPAGRP
jgi:hypothetical protein